MKENQPFSHHLLSVLGYNDTPIHQDSPTREGKFRVLSSRQSHQRREIRSSIFKGEENLLRWPQALDWLTDVEGEASSDNSYRVGSVLVKRHEQLSAHFTVLADGKHLCVKWRGEARHTLA